MASTTIGNYTHHVNWTVVNENVAAGTFDLRVTWRIHRDVSAGNGAFTGIGRDFTLGCTGESDKVWFRTFDFRDYADWSPISGTTNTSTYATFTGLSVNAEGDKNFTISIETEQVSTGFPAATRNFNGSHHMDRNVVMWPSGGSWKPHLAYWPVDGEWKPVLAYWPVGGSWKQAGAA